MVHLVNALSAPFTISIHETLATEEDGSPGTQYNPNHTACWPVLFLRFMDQSHN